MITIVCDWNGDLGVGPGGDICVAPIQAAVQERIIRRLLTNPGGYIWHTNYGAGLAGYVGEPYSPSVIESTVLSQLRLEVLVAASPAPVVQTNRPTAGSFSATSVTVQYQIAGTTAGNSIVLPLGA
jgi:hypothetical protein